MRETPSKGRLWILKIWFQKEKSTNVFVVIKDLDFEMILQERNEKFVYLLEIQF